MPNLANPDEQIRSGAPLSREHMGSYADAESIGRKELKGVLGAFEHSHEWYAVFKKLKIGTLPKLIMAKEGALRKEGGANEVDAIKAIAADVQRDGGPTIKALGEHDMVSVLLRVLSSARRRLPACEELIHQASGLPKGDKKRDGTVDVEQQWEACALQRLGSAVPDEERGSDKLLTKMYKQLNDSSNRRLASVDLRTDVKSALDESVDDDEEEEEEGGSKKKERTVLGLAGCVVKCKIAFMTLSAAAGNEIPEKSPLKREPGEGDITSAGAKTVTLDGSYLDCMAAHQFVTLQMIAAKAAQKSPAEVFYRFWTTLQRRVSATAHGGKRTVSGAIYLAMEAFESAEGVSKLVETKSPPPRKRTSGNAPARGNNSTPRKQQRREENGKAKKKDAASGAVGRKPNSSGELCNTFYTTGSCPYGARCRHKHLNAGEDKNDTSLKDVRER
jgi:hypothetical protein